MNRQGTPIALPLRIWLGVEILFGIGAVLAIGLAPAESKTNFAWTINPVVMAAVLGAFYMSSAPLFILPFFSKRWEMIRIMILPTALFSTIQLVATFLHWDKFSIGSTPFYVWFASYLLPPPIFIAAYLWHQRKAKNENSKTDDIPTWLRWILLIVGIIFVLIAFIAFFLPNILISIFPWQLTPLTSRSLSGWIAIVGVLMLSMYRENHRTRSRLATPMLILILPTLLLQLTRFSNEVNWANLTLWFGLILFAVVMFCGIYLAVGSWKDAMS
ncbi:MAG: hypothetical protein KF758_07005 [Anaerolineales bacterium]|nr:hypothetical protein [Anaerolineales bacterium]MBX3036644.1 hypothetical protein [Anaerolineales bacterium]